MPTVPDLSIIIPAYKEADIIEASLDTLADYLNEHDMGEVEVVVVVADSPDSTARLVSSKATLFKSFKLVAAGPRVGKGRDVRYGIFEATGRYKLFMDADLATPIHHLGSVEKLMNKNAQVGIAVRNLWAIHDSPSRKIMSKCANLVAQALAVPGIKDTQCGFKLFEASAADAIFSRQTMLKWSFDIEILAIARHLGYEITTFDIDDWHDPKEPSKGLVGDSIYRIILGGILDPIKIRLNLMLGLYTSPGYKYKK